MLCLFYDLRRQLLSRSLPLLLWNMTGRLRGPMESALLDLFKLCTCTSPLLLLNLLLIPVSYVPEQVFGGQWKQSKKVFTFRGDSNWLGFDKVSSFKILHNFLNFIHQRCTCRFTNACCVTIFLISWHLTGCAQHHADECMSSLKTIKRTRNDEKIRNIKKYNCYEKLYRDFTILPVHSLHQLWPTSNLISDMYSFMHCDGNSLLSLNLLCWQCPGKDVLGGWCDSGSIFVADVAVR